MSNMEKSNEDEAYLTNDEIDDFVAKLDINDDGIIAYSELETRLDEVYHQLVNDLQSHHLTHASRDDQRHEFLRGMMSPHRDHQITRDEFKDIVRSWRIPSLQQEKKAEAHERAYLDDVAWPRRLRSYWEVDGPEWAFLLVVVALQIGLGVWQCYKYAAGRRYQAAFGWGVGLAKAAAGALYPTLFFMVLSMSRWFATGMRKFYHVSRAVNWDRSQRFHIIMALAALVLATVHAIGHLSGTFNWGSRQDRQDAVVDLVGRRMRYIDYIRILPGWSGLSALGLFYVITLLSMPWVRRKSYEVFQLGHLLMFPMLGLLMAHGGKGILQYPAMGFVLIVPTTLVIGERVTRFLAGFHRIPARARVLDDETVCVTVTMPRDRIWSYKAGQYVLLQVPQISRFQWHSFTISTCIGRRMKLHIKTDGDWTGRLRELAKTKSLKHVGIDGPFGAPAQRFYDFDQTIIVGAGIGVTPFSGILNDLQTREDHRWMKPHKRSVSLHRSIRDRAVNALSRSGSAERGSPSPSPSSMHEERPPLWRTETESSIESLEDDSLDLNLYRRVDFHWIVRDKNQLLWFSSLLNRIASPPHDPHLTINLQAHLTSKPPSSPNSSPISQHVYRHLLERHRTASQTVSPLTGLVAPTSFGRPDFPVILDRHYEEMVELFARDPERRRRVGVFFCGAPAVGRILADLCRTLTVRGRQEGMGIEYHFMNEVFG